MAEPGLIRIHWPNGRQTLVASGTDWLEAARNADVPIPTGCLGGSCGACEISADGSTLRACLAVVPTSPTGEITVEFCTDPTW